MHYWKNCKEDTDIYMILGNLIFWAREASYNTEVKH